MTTTKPAPVWRTDDEIRKLQAAKEEQIKRYVALLVRDGHQPLRRRPRQVGLVPVADEQRYQSPPLA